MNWVLIGTIIAIGMAVYGYYTGWAFLSRMPMVGPYLLNETGNQTVPNELKNPGWLTGIFDFLGKNIVLPLWLLIIIVLLIAWFRH